MAIYTPLLFLFGLAAGTMGTMMGVGMGFVHVPFLILVFDFSPQDAVATSIAVIFINTLSGSLIYYHQRRMDIELAAKLSVAVLPGAIVGPFIVDQFSSSVFSLLFAGVLLISAMLLMFGQRPLSVLPKTSYNRRAQVRDIFGHKVSYDTNTELGVVGTVIIGFLSNLLGVGGGIVHVPFLILLLRIPTHIAIGTSHMILCVSSLAGTIV
ncbi:MAG: sulfite exporter TauE/SafE family protein, partial [Polyangiaceae bacterium]|nr:sulfite exporter TauE/SafE family protein [Polyangiaceae bacterium]